jgi:YD repeat-containing protein
MKATRCFYVPAVLVLLAAAGCDTNAPMDIPEGFAGHTEEWDESFYVTNDVTYPKDSKLKRVIQMNEDNTYSQLFEEYEYDKSGRITKRIFPTSAGSYHSYGYNNKGQLSSISKYYDSTLTQRIAYEYDGQGNRTKEQQTNAATEQLTSTTLYIYENGKLVVSEHWMATAYSDNTQHIIQYSYNSSGELISEWLSVPGEEGHVTTANSYHDGLLYYTVTYSGDDKESGFMFDTKKIYDRNGNLVMTIHDMPGLSSSLPVVGQHFYEIRRYEY